MQKRGVWELLDQGKETVTTTPTDAQPDRIVEMPEDSWAPILLAGALLLLFAALLAKAWAVIAIGGMGSPAHLEPP